MDAEQRKRDVQLDPARMKLAEYERNDWVVNAELGTTLEDIQTTSFFAHMAKDMKMYDHIEVRIDDGTWLAYLIVLDTGRNWAKVKLLNHVCLIDGDAVPVASVMHSVEFKGPQFKWSVIRLSDKEKIKTGCSTRIEAEAWMREHETVTG